MQQPGCGGLSNWRGRNSGQSRSWRRAPRGWGVGRGFPSPQRDGGASRTAPVAAKMQFRRVTVTAWSAGLRPAPPASSGRPRTCCTQGWREAACLAIWPGGGTSSRPCGPRAGQRPALQACGPSGRVGSASVEHSHARRVLSPRVPSCGLGGGRGVPLRRPSAWRAAAGAPGGRPPGAVPGRPSWCGRAGG